MGLIIKKRTTYTDNNYSNELGSKNTNTFEIFHVATGGEDLGPGVHSEFDRITIIIGTHPRLVC